MWGLLVLVCLAGVVRGFGMKASSLDVGTALLRVRALNVGGGHSGDQARAPDREGAASVAIAISEPRSLERLGGAFTHANVWEPNVQAAGPPLEKERQAVAAAGGAPTGNSTQGGTVCQCICGDRVVWHRLIFAGDVEKEKEKECEEEVCPHVIIPGLRVYAECNYVEDLTDLTAGTLCDCQCGDKTAWRDRAFYGDVRKEKEKYCLEELCPLVSPIPGLRFEASCSFDRQLYALPRPRPRDPYPAAKRPLMAKSQAAVRRPFGAALLAALAIAAGAAGLGL